MLSLGPDMSSQFRQRAITLACAGLKLALLPWRRAPRRREPPARILVLRRCCLGDVLMTTPLLRALRGAYPRASITYAVGGWSAAALRDNPDLDGAIVLPERLTWRAWVRLTGRLRRERFDLAVLPERSPLVGLVALLAGIPRRVGLDSAHRGFALTDPAPVRGVRHEVERALDLARALGLQAPSPRLNYRPSAAAEAVIAALLDRHAAREPLFVVHPGGGVNPGVTMDEKRWPPERFAAVADALLERHGGAIILVGAASDRAVVAATAAALRHEALNLCGGLDLDALAALCRRATLYLGNDSGTTHLAEACGAPTVVVFGPTDPAMYGPIDGVGEAVWDPVACAPVVRRDDLTRAGGTTGAVRCIDSVTVEQVLAAADRVLQRAARRKDSVAEA